MKVIENPPPYLWHPIDVIDGMAELAGMIGEIPDMFRHLDVADGVDLCIDLGGEG